MKKIIFSMMVFTILGTISSPSSAIGIDTKGARSCETWIKNKQDPLKHAIDLTWLAGYLSGLASGLNKDFLSGITIESISPWVDGYCQANPLGNSGDAGDNLAHQLVKQKGL